jgi:hypothetical protein
MRGAWSGTGFALFPAKIYCNFPCLADAADESLVLVRSMDREQLDLAALHATVADFVKRVDLLFKQGGRMTVESSFTQHCLTLLSTRQLQVLEQGKL